MAFEKKTWLQRIVTNPGRRRLNDTGTSNVFDVARAEGEIVQEGDGFTVANMNGLENRIEAGFGEKINKTQIINNLAATIAGNVLDATQGKALDDKIGAINTNLDNLMLYSTAEVRIGTTHDGKGVYMKEYFGVISWNDSTITSRLIPHGITNLRNLNITGLELKESAGSGVSYALPYTPDGTVFGTWYQGYNNTNIIINNRINWTNYQLHFKLEYTKTV